MSATATPVDGGGRRRVLVAMSGGVDSSVAAALLVEAGHEVVGATLRLWGGPSDSGCCSVADVEDARWAAAELGIEHHVFAYGEAFERDVVDPYVAEHAAGRTPNPCIECNRHLKFGALADRARRLGFDAVATGHHARVVTGPDGWLRVARGADGAKDQSYVLHPLDQAGLARTLLPVGHLTKDEVRARAVELGLRTAAKPDSQDLCFVPSVEGRAAFLARRVPLHPGRLVDADGDVVGEVPAVELVTVGQRRGLGLAGGTAGRFAVDVDVEARTVRVGDVDDLLVATTSVVGLGWSAGPVSGPVLAQCSAHGRARPAEVVPAGDGTAEVRWAEPVRRVAPGQAVVLYDLDDRLVLGGGQAR